MTLWDSVLHLAGQSPGPARCAVHFVLPEKFIEMCVNDSNRKSSPPLYHYVNLISGLLLYSKAFSM